MSLKLLIVNPFLTPPAFWHGQDGDESRFYNAMPFDNQDKIVAQARQYIRLAPNSVVCVYTADLQLLQTYDRASHDMLPSVAEMERRRDARLAAN